MHKIAVASLIAGLLLAAVPAQAGHEIETVTANYTSGGSVSTSETGGLGLSVCFLREGFPDSQPGAQWQFCVGGGNVITSHTDEGDYSLGFSKVSGTITDAGSGSNIDWSLCMGNENDNDATDACDGVDDVTVSGCGLSLAADAGAAATPFKGIDAWTFASIVSVDASTSGVCVATSGTFSLIFQ